jgi:ABC-2 type transport system ATP-binding protein
VLEGLPARAALARADELGSLLGLTELMGRDFGSLSTGQRQRMAIARGLISDPPVILFDEATRSLDPGRSERLRRIIRKVLVERENKAVIFATHDLEEARVLADRVVLMRDGRVAAEGSYADLEAQIGSAFREESSGEEAEFRRLFPDLEVSL